MAARHAVLAAALMGLLCLSTLSQARPLGTNRRALFERAARTAADSLLHKASGRGLRRALLSTATDISDFLALVGGVGSVGAGRQCLLGCLPSTRPAPRRRTGDAQSRSYPCPPRPPCLALLALLQSNADIVSEWNAVITDLGLGALGLSDDATSQLEEALQKFGADVIPPVMDAVRAHESELQAFVAAVEAKLPEGEPTNEGELGVWPALLRADVRCAARCPHCGSVHGSQLRGNRARHAHPPSSCCQRARARTAP